MKTSVNNTLRLIALAAVLGLGVNYALAWTGPTSVPPNGNTPAPINVGSSAQVKSGGLGVADFVANSVTVGGTANSSAVTSPKFCIGTVCITSWPTGMLGGYCTSGTPHYPAITCVGSAGNHVGSCAAGWDYALAWGNGYGGYTNIQTCVYNGGTGSSGSSGGNPSTGTVASPTYNDLPSGAVAGYCGNGDGAPIVPPATPSCGCPAGWTRIHLGSFMTAESTIPYGDAYSCIKN